MQSTRTKRNVKYLYGKSGGSGYGTIWHMLLEEILCPPLGLHSTLPPLPLSKQARGNKQNVCSRPNSKPSRINNWNTGRVCPCSETTATLACCNLSFMVKPSSHSGPQRDLDCHFRSLQVTLTYVTMTYFILSYIPQFNTSTCMYTR